MRKVADYLLNQYWPNWRWRVPALSMVHLPADSRIQAAEDSSINSVDGDIQLLINQPTQLNDFNAIEKAIAFARYHPGFGSLWWDIGQMEKKSGADSSSNLIHFPPTTRCRNALFSQIGFSQSETGQKNLLMVVPWLETGGADRCNLDIARHLKQQGWHVTIVATLACEHRWERIFRQITDDFFLLPRFIEAEGAYDFIEYLLRTRQPQGVMISNAWFGYDVVAQLRERFPGIFLFDLNHMEEDWSDGGFPGFAVRYTSCFDRHWVISQHLKDWLVARGVAESKIDVLHWYADSRIWQPSSSVRQRQRERLAIEKDAVVIAYVGRICPQKRPDIFAAVMAGLAERRTNFRAVVIGDGELMPALESDVQRYGLDGQVHLLGWQTQEQVRDWMQAADIFFLPSENEGIALVLYEALASGLVVVGADVGGQAELVDSDCGFLIRADTSENEITHYVSILDRLSTDPVLLSRMKENAIRRVRERFDLTHFNDNLQQLLNNMPRQAFVANVIEAAVVPRAAVARLKAQWSSARLLTAWRPTRYPGLDRWVVRLIKGLCHIRYLGFKVLLRKLSKSVESA